MSVFKKWLSGFQKEKAAAEKQQRLLQSEVQAFIVADAIGRSNRKPEEAAALLSGAIDEGLVSEAQAEEIHDLATKGFTFLQGGEASPIDLEPLYAARAEMITRHREELAANGQSIVAAESHNQQIQESRQQFQLLAREAPEVAAELVKQVKLSWSPKVGPRGPMPGTIEEPL